MPFLVSLKLEFNPGFSVAFRCSVSSVFLLFSLCIPSFFVGRFKTVCDVFAKIFVWFNIFRCFNRRVVCHIYWKLSSPTVEIVFYNYCPVTLGPSGISPTSSPANSNPLMYNTLLLALKLPICSFTQSLPTFSTNLAG